MIINIILSKVNLISIEKLLKSSKLKKSSFYLKNCQNSKIKIIQK